MYIYIYTRTTRALRARLGSSKRQPLTRSRLHAVAITNASGSWVLQTAPCNRESQFLSTKIGTHSANVPPTASQTRCASRPAAYFGTLITRSVPHKEFHLRPQRQGSQSAPPAHCGAPLTRIVLKREHHPQIQRQGSHIMPPPISARSSRGSCPGRSSTYGANGQLRRAFPRPFRHMPHTGRAQQGAPPTASMGVFQRVHPEYSATPSCGPCSTRSSARLRTLAQQPQAGLPRVAQCMKRGPRPALHVAADGCALRQANCLLIYWPSAHTATVPGLWDRGFLDTCWGLLACFSGASWSQL